MTKTCKDCGESKPLSDFYKTRKYYRSYCKPCHKMRSTEERKGKDVNKWRTIKSKYGLTREGWDDLWDSQQGMCKICNTAMTTEERMSKTKAVVDHCHDSGKVRALLCHRCNVAIGLLREDKTIVENVLVYLEDTKDEM